VHEEPIVSTQELFMYVRSGQRVTMHIKRVFAANFVG
jgi:hypothetical protein